MLVLVLRLKDKAKDSDAASDTSVESSWLKNSEVLSSRAADCEARWLALKLAAVCARLKLRV